MRRVLLHSTTFMRAAQRLVKKHPEAAPLLQVALAGLAEDAFQHVLRTHKLKGELAGSWASSLGYNLRIIFAFVQHEGAESILLQTVGTHDEVY